MMDRSNCCHWIFVYGCIIATLSRISYFEVVNAGEVYTLCDDPDSHLIQILSLELNPNPIVIPGSTDFSVTFNVTTDIEGPIAVNVSTAERLKDGSWRPISCMDYGVDQCDSENICDEPQFNSNNSCPSYVTEAGLSCSCPFSAGVYSFHNLTTDLFFLLDDLELLINFNMTTANSTVTCIDFNIFLTPYFF